MQNSYYWKLEDERCPTCGAEEIKSKGKYKAKTGTRQYLECKKCGEEFYIIIQYKAIKMMCDPKERRTIERLEQNIESIDKMYEISKSTLQKTLYKQFKQEGFDISSRVYDLMGQRIAGTLTKNKIIPVDERNYRIIKEGNNYLIRLLAKSYKNHQKDAYELIPIYRPDNKYYAPIEDGFNRGGLLFMQGRDWFFLTSVPFKKKQDKKRKNVFIGIDLNQRKHAASLLIDGTYLENFFFDLKPVDDKCKELQQKMSAVQQGKRNSDLTSEEKKQLDKLYNTRSKIIKKAHGDFIRSKLLPTADRYWGKGYNVYFVLEDLKGITKRVRKHYAPFNRWLHQQWTYEMFKDVLDGKQYPVLSVNPRYTSKHCHICDGKVKIYGKRKRKIRCEFCDYKEFNRDLNAARNIAKRGKEKVEST